MQDQDWKSITWTKQTEQQQKKQQHKSNNTAVRLHKLENNTGECSSASNKKTNSREFAKQLQSARLNKKWTQITLAQKINEKVGNINNYESGNTMPSSSTINKLSKVLDIQFKFKLNK